MIPPPVNALKRDPPALSKSAVPDDCRWQTVGAFEVRVGHDAGTAMTRSSHVKHVQVTRLDHPIEIGVDEVQAGRGPEVTQESRLLHASEAVALFQKLFFSQDRRDVRSAG
jgi:hypothetical protein